MTNIAALPDIALEAILLAISLEKGALR